MASFNPATCGVFLHCEASDCTGLYFSGNLRDGHANFIPHTKMKAFGSESVRRCTSGHALLRTTPVPFAANLHTKRRSKEQIGKSQRRSVMYGDTENYVLLEPGEDEQFVTQEELQAKLKSWLTKWPAGELPKDVEGFGDLDEAISHLIESACELDLGGGTGSIQWFEVRL